MAQKVDFAIGTEFNSLDEFRNRLDSYEKQEFCNFVVASSQKLNATADISADVVGKFGYKYIRYTCKKFGDPRNVNPANEKRQSKSYRDECKSFFSVGLKQKDGDFILRIINLIENHNHGRNSTLFKSMPKQRRNTISGSAPFLAQVANVKPNTLLLQNELTHSSENNQPVKRSDVKNALAKIRKKPDDTNDLVSMVNAMKKIQGAVVKVYHNSQNELEYFQDRLMKQFFDSFPELLLFDATFSLNDRRMPLIILLVVDGNGESQIVGLFLARTENAEILNALLNHFKIENPRHSDIDVVLTDKGYANLNSVATQFPNATHHFCIFHVGQTFEREVTTKKRNITIAQRHECLRIMNRMVYCESDRGYESLYNDLQNTQCPEVIRYFDENWGNIQEQWVKYHVTKHMMMGNSTTNRVESLNLKLKAVITKYSSLPQFFQHLIDSVGSMRIEKDMRAAEDVNRRPVNTVNYGVHDRKYAKILTDFAFKKYFTETENHTNVQFTNIDQRIAVSGSTQQRLLTTAMVCDCIFYTSMRLPCRHILAFRQQNNHDLFESTICHDRWLKSNMHILSQYDYVHDDEPQLEIVDTTSQNQRTRAKKTQNQKYRLAKNKCEELCTNIADLPERLFEEKYQLLCQLLKDISEGRKYISIQSDFCLKFLFFSFCFTNKLTIFCFFSSVFISLL